MIIKFMKKNLDKILITIGSILIISSLIYMYKWSMYQSIFLNKHKEEVHTYMDSVIKDEKSLVVFENKEEKSENKKSESIENEKSESIKPEILKITRQEYMDGDMIIHIPKLDITAGVMKGTSIEELKIGPGLYEMSPLVTKDNGNVCIAGHRTTYGKWFRDIDKLETGDEVILEFQEKKYIYNLEKVFVVDKKDWSITDPTGYQAITLSACHPLGSAEQRIVARGKLIEIK